MHAHRCQVGQMESGDSWELWLSVRPQVSKLWRGPLLQEKERWGFGMAGRVKCMHSPLPFRPALHSEGEALGGSRSPAGVTAGWVIRRPAPPASKPCSGPGALSLLATRRHEYATFPALHPIYNCLHPKAQRGSKQMSAIQ